MDKENSTFISQEIFLAVLTSFSVTHLQPLFRSEALEKGTRFARSIYSVVYGTNCI